MNWRIRLKSPGVIGLGAALLLALLALLPLQYPLHHKTFNYMAITDITRSMNVEDYRMENQRISRLEYVKSALRLALKAMPCGSRLGLGVFTERRAFVLFEPIEVCAGFGAIDAAIAQIDWRMAWEADSRIADGLYNTLEQLQDQQASLLFITDGHEAPPTNPRYRKPLEPFQGKVKGIIVGVGALTPSPIPKFNANGEQTGFYSADDVPHRSTFGLPEMAPDEIEGYHARNAPFGNASGGGTEHLSSLKEAYLRQLSIEAGLHYTRLETPKQFVQTLMQADMAQLLRSEVDIRWIPASLALLALLPLYLPSPLSANRLRQYGNRLGHFLQIKNRSKKA